ncbi:MAG: LUD domain-containing protein [Nitrososphaerota archaeon]|nr:LUD domain-containing protein [Nitrososphaerota archaeon]
MPKTYDSLKRKIISSLGRTQQTKFLQAAMKRGRDARRAQLISLGSTGEVLRHDVHMLKNEAILNLDSLVKMFMENCERNGATVRLMKDGEEVVEYIAKLSEQKGSKHVIKSKSLTTEEIELNQRLVEKVPFLDVVETDLGERIIQLAGEKPFHLVFPAVHKTQAEIAQLFSKEVAGTVPDDLQEIMKAVRRVLRPTFLSGQIGITGANVGVAETGTILVEENEGNARLVSAIPDVHVVVMGMEKIVRSWDDALKLAMAHPVSATGTRLTNYVSMISSRLELSGHADRSLHVLILDNGRSKMSEDPWFKEALNCIRCGACMNACPTYGVVGGHVFGYIYPGPIGIPWTEAVHGLEKASEFAHLCVACGLCKEICPADIDIPMMIAKVKEEDVQKNGQLIPNTVLSRSDDFAKLASATAPLSNWIIQSRVSRTLTDRFLGIDKKRKLPRFERQTLEKRFSKGASQNITEALAKVAFFPDISANYNEPDRALTALQLLQKAGVAVEIPKNLKPSGMPYISYGDLVKARKIALHNVSILKDYVQRGYDIVSMEPTAVYCLRDSYLKLLDESSEALNVSKYSFEYFEYLAKYAKIDPSIGKGKVVGVHIPCHERALSSSKYAIKLLENAGYKVKVIETGTCCGMAGTFGLKKGPLGYDLSMAVGKPLFELFNEDTEIELIATESSVCAEQLSDGTKRKVVHPIELLTG